MRYLTFDFSEGDDDVTTIEAMASTAAADHAAVLREVQQILDWAWQSFPDTHGSADEGADWDHDIQVHVEDGQWHAVTLTLTASAPFLDDFLVEFGSQSA